MVFTSQDNTIWTDLVLILVIVYLMLVKTKQNVICENMENFNVKISYCSNIFFYYGSVFW